MDYLTQPPLFIDVFGHQTIPKYMTENPSRDFESVESTKKLVLEIPHALVWVSPKELHTINRSIFTIVQVLYQIISILEFELI